LEHLCLTR